MEYQDEEDLLLEQIEKALDSDSMSSDSQVKVGARDVLVKEARSKLLIQGILVEIEETLKLRPPREAFRAKSGA